MQLTKKFSGCSEESEQPCSHDSVISVDTCSLVLQGCLCAPFLSLKRFMTRKLSCLSKSSNIPGRLIPFPNRGRLVVAAGKEFTERSPKKMVKQLKI